MIRTLTAVMQQCRWVGSSGCGIGLHIASRIWFIWALQGLAQKEGYAGFSVTHRVQG